MDELERQHLKRPVFAVRISPRNSRSGQNVKWMVTAATIELTTWSAERNPTMCEVTWHTWRTCERSWCQSMRSFVSVVSLFLLSVSVVVLWLSSLIDARTLWFKFKVWVLFTHRHTHVSCTLSDLFDLSIHFMSYLFISLIFLLFLLPYTFYFLDVVDNKPAPLPLRSWPLGQKELFHRLWGQRPLHHGGFMSSTPRSPWPSNGSLKTSTTMTSPSVRRSLMRAEDEPITLKKKACPPVCRRRQWVMIERGNPLFAVT